LNNSSEDKTEIKYQYVNPNKAVLIKCIKYATVGWGRHGSQICPTWYLKKKIQVDFWPKKNTAFYNLTSNIWALFNKKLSKFGVF
jgi:hypothetical protein